MRMDRRSVVLGMPVIASIATLAPTVQSKARCIAQTELDDAIYRHAKWLKRDGGARAVFAGCELSGLLFGSDANELVDLNSADFTEADLSGATGGRISFNYASLFGARLTGSRFAEPGFIGANLSHAICDHVQWGCPQSGAAQRLVDADGAVFHHTQLMRSDLSYGRVRGHFYGARFPGATMIGTDFSYSDFSSGDETSFYGADLSGASFADARLAAVRFAKAKLEDTIFERADFGKHTIRNLSRMGRNDIFQGGHDDQIS